MVVVVVVVVFVLLPNPLRVLGIGDLLSVILQFSTRPKVSHTRPAPVLLYSTQTPP